MVEKISQEDLLKEYFIENPNRNISHPEVVDWATKEYVLGAFSIFLSIDIKRYEQAAFIQFDGYLDRK